MLFEFKAHPDGATVEVNTKQVMSVAHAVKDPTIAIIRFLDGREIVVAESYHQVMEKLQ